MSKKYTVGSYDAYELPDPDAHWFKAGEFDTADEALKCAQNIVSGSLEGLYRANTRLDAEGLMMAYRCHGEVVTVRGEPRVEFHAYRFAEQHICKIMAWAAAGWFATAA